jgi:hypothetical protein
MEESGNGSVLVTNGSGCGSGRPKIIRIRIPNTAVNIIITLDLRGKKTHFFTDIGTRKRIKFKKKLFAYHMFAKFMNTLAVFGTTGTNKDILMQYCGPGSGIGCLFDPWIRDWRKSASGSGMNNPDDIF